MPELPEVEVLVRHLRPLVRNQIIRRLEVRRARVLAPTSPRELRRALAGARICDLTRRGKYLLFQLRPPRRGRRFTLVGHLGMTGRFFLIQNTDHLPRHTAVVLDLGTARLVYEDPRGFGRLTLDARPLARLGPEPFDREFNAQRLRRVLRRSRQAIKVRLLDQALVAGIGNIYASEALFRARLSPTLPSRELSVRQLARLCEAVREVMTEAIQSGSTVPLHFAAGRTDGLFYFGRARGGAASYGERLRVYDRAGDPCPRCGRRIRRAVQASRSTFFCPRCQRDWAVRRRIGKAESV